MDYQHAIHIVVLTGGRSTRMGGRHKPGILVAGRSIIDRKVATVWSAVSAAEIVLAGTATGLSHSLCNQVTLVREDPPFSGPLAGVAAALQAIPRSAGVVILLGGDLPFLTPETITRLREAVVGGTEVASCLDATGHLQYLCSGWRQDVLRRQVEQIADPDGIPLRALFRGLSPELIDCDPNELRDIDTPGDLARAVTTSDGRPVPQSLLAAVEHVRHERGSTGLALTPQQTVEILDFARDVKYAPSVANPVVAAFLAGQLAGSATGGSLVDALRAVFDVVGTGAQLGDVEESARHPAGSGDIGCLPAGDEHSGEVHGYGSG